MPGESRALPGSGERDFLWPQAAATEHYITPGNPPAIHAPPTATRAAASMTKR